MSLSNVLLIHVSSRYMPRTEEEEQTAQEREYYALLDLPKYSPICEIRKAYRRITLKYQCDRMMLEWNAPSGHLLAADDPAVHAYRDATSALHERETLVKEAFRILGDKHMRQQYHLLQCRPYRYKMIHGPLALIHGITMTRRWFPLMVLQTVLVATLVNAVVAQYQPEEWVYILLPSFGYYGLVVVFWLTMLDFPWRRHCTLRSFATMLSAALQHVCLWNGFFWMARYWDRATGPHINWYILSIPFYLAILFRCHCALAAAASLRDLQSKMISRDFFERQQLASNSVERDKDCTALPDGFVIVTQDSTLLTSHLMQLNVSNDDMEELKLVESARVETSPEFRQVDYAAKTLHRAAVQLATLGSAFVTLVALKLEDELDVTWWLIFAPVWIHMGIRLYFTCRGPTRAPAPAAAGSNSTSTTNTAGQNTPSSTDGPTTTSAPEENGAEPADAEEEAPSKSVLNASTKSLWTGEYTGLDVVLDIPTQSFSHHDAEDLEDSHPASPSRREGCFENDHVTTDIKREDPLQSLPVSVQLTLNGAERDVEAALPLTPTTQNSLAPDRSASTRNVPLETMTVTENAADNDGRAEEPAVHEEFERWQSVYENQEVRSGHFYFIPCELFFHVLIICLTVAKLDESYENTRQGGSSFNAFYVMLIPFSVAFLVCCCALLAGFIALNTEGAPGNVAGQDVTNPSSDANSDSEELVPMQAGANDPREKTFSAHLDVPRPDLTFSQRVQILAAVLAISTTDAETWLMENDATFLSSSKTWWKEVITCAIGLNCETVKWDVNMAEIEAFDNESILLLRTNLEAHFEKSKFQTQLDAITPLDEMENNASGIECPVCCEQYDLKDMVCCEGNPIHFFCRVCFHRYATETIQEGDIAGMPCADVNCEAMFSKPTVTANLSKWEVLRQRDRENERNEKVGLAAKAVLQCICGAVGIVTDEEVGDGCITCPGEGCAKQYCALCGNTWHPETSCPPTKKMLQWVVQNTMPCPNCRMPIEKNFGCDHMHCAPPGGCGHHFSYRTGKPMSKQGQNLRGLYH